jgi:hypothetical protein
VVQRHGLQDFKRFGFINKGKWQAYFRSFYPFPAYHTLSGLEACRREWRFQRLSSKEALVRFTEGQAAFLTEVKSFHYFHSTK